MRWSIKLWREPSPLRTAAKTPLELFQRKPSSMTEGTILQSCRHSWIRSSHLSFMQHWELPHAPKPESKIPGSLHWAQCHSAEQEHMSWLLPLGLQGQRLRKTKLSILPLHSVTLVIHFRHKPRTVWFYWVKPTNTEPRFTEARSLCVSWSYRTSSATEMPLHMDATLPNQSCSSESDTWVLGDEGCTEQNSTCR